MNKVVKDGMVAVLYSPGYGAGWSTWNDEHEKSCLFCPEIVRIVESEDYPTKELVRDVMTISEKLFGDKGFYSGGADQLRVIWIKEGKPFRISEYDGYESVEYCDSVDWVVA